MALAYEDRHIVAPPPGGARYATEMPLTAEQGRIPKERYTSLEFHRAEIERMWKRVWQMACRVEDLPDAGDWVEYSIADQSYLVVRAEDGRFRAFNNVCLHRGNQLRSGLGNSRELRCGYHFWTWNLDGSLKDVPDRDLFVGVDESTYSLPQIQCDTWGGFVFVNPDPSAGTLSEFLGPEVVAQLEPYHLERHVTMTNVTTPVAANWKVVVEAFLEVYHVQGIHPQLLPMLDDVNTSYENFDTHSRMIVPFGVPSMRLDDVAPQELFEAFLRSSGSAAKDSNGASQPTADGEMPSPDPKPAVAGSGAYKATSPLDDMVDGDGNFTLGDQLSVREWLISRTEASGEDKGLDFSGLSHEQMIDDFHYHLFPNLVFNTHAGGFLFFRIRPDWDDPDRCYFDVMRFVWPSETERAEWEPKANVEVAERSISFGEVLDQDLENLPGVQRGLRSDGLTHVTVSKQELRIVKLHEVIDRYLEKV